MRRSIGDEAMKFLISAILIIALLGAIIATVKFLLAAIGLVLLIVVLYMLLSFVTKSLQG
jgi:hypothetical protein